MRFVGTWLVTTVAVAAAIWLVPGIGVVGGVWASALFTALALAFVNALVKPVVQLLSLPITCLTLGLFSLVINASMLELASWLSRNVLLSGIYIESFGSALAGAVVVSVVTALLGSLAGTDEDA